MIRPAPLYWNSLQWASVMAAAIGRRRRKHWKPCGNSYWRTVLCFEKRKKHGAVPVCLHWRGTAINEAGSRSSRSACAAGSTGKIFPICTTARIFLCYFQTDCLLWCQRDSESFSRSMPFSKKRKTEHGKNGTLYKFI